MHILAIWDKLDAGGRLAALDLMEQLAAGKRPMAPMTTPGVHIAVVAPGSPPKLHRLDLIFADSLPYAVWSRSNDGAPRQTIALDLDLLAHPASPGGDYLWIGPPVPAPLAMQ
jgi:hypothetical protein